MNSSTAERRASSRGHAARHGHRRLGGRDRLLRMIVDQRVRRICRSLRIEPSLRICSRLSFHAIEDVQLHFRRSISRSPRARRRDVAVQVRRGARGDGEGCLGFSLSAWVWKCKQESGDAGCPLQRGGGGV